MTVPAPVAGWLDIADVRKQLGYLSTDVSDDELIQRAIDATEPEVIRCRPDSLPDPALVPDAYQGAVMLAAKIVRRRNSPAGVESFTSSVISSASGDPELDRLLHTGGYRHPATG